MLYRKGYRAPYWRAPEVLRGEASSKASDVYAYGMLLYEVLYRREPFEKENKEVWFMLYVQMNTKDTMNITPKHYSHDCQLLVADSACRLMT